MPRRSPSWDGSPQLPVRRVERDDEGRLDPDAWPATIPAIAQLLEQGLDLGPLTVLVGENGAGKSTIVEAVASRFGLNPEGGSTNSRFSTRPTESPLDGAIRLVRGAGAPHWGYFLRVEGMHSMFSYLEDNPDPRGCEPRFHRMSHGESFVSLLQNRFTRPGFYVSTWEGLEMVGQHRRFMDNPSRYLRHLTE